MTPKQINVLLFPAGTEIGLEIAQALCHCKEIKLYAAGQDVSNHARFVHGKYFTIPSVREKSWETSLINLCINLEIEYIFPCHDDVIVALSRIRNILPAIVVTSPQETCEITRSKSATYQRLKGVIPTPDVYSDINLISHFPVLVKPDKGQGSAGVTIVNNNSELAIAINNVNEPIVCEYLPGIEYTVDCISDREKGVLYAKARTRNRTRNGISVNSKTTDDLDVRSMADAIQLHIPLYGAWFFQIKCAQNGILTLLEIGPRIAGSMAVHRVRGINFPLLSIFEQQRINFTIFDNNQDIEMDRALTNRYQHSIAFKCLYIDLDDTLIIHGAINLLAIKLIYKSINEGKFVHLLTRHKGDLKKLLIKSRLSSLFDSIIHVLDDSPKSKYITGDSPIFIDDSFSERLEVATTLNIPTFDSSMIECLTETTIQ